MDKHENETPKTVKATQPTAMWFKALFVLVTLFLAAATKIPEPVWVSPTLVVAAIALVPVFLVGIFLMQTKFRKELQDDPYYNKCLKP